MGNAWTGHNRQSCARMGHWTLCCILASSIFCRCGPPVGWCLPVNRAFQPQEFNTRKMLESGLRRTLHSAQEISAVGPGRYARRFMDYMHKVFA